MKIIATPIDNGTRFHDVEGGFTVDVTRDQRWFTIYDSFDEPVGTIERPPVIGNKLWGSYHTNGQACTKSAVGPRSAFRSFILGYRS